ncbi:AsmA family protein [Spirochaetota bacterium]
MKGIKYIKIASIVLASSIILFSASALVFINFFPKEKVLNIIISNAEDSLKRKVKISGINYGFRGIELKGVMIYDGPSPENPILAESDEANLGFSILALLQFKLDINHIYFKNLKLNILYDENGTSNLEKLINLSSKNKGEESVSIKISSIILDNSKIALKNPPKILKALEGIYQITTKISVIKKGHLKFTKCKIKLPDTRGTVYPDVNLLFGKNLLDIYGNVGVDRFSFRWLFPWSKISIPYYNLSGNVNNFKLIRTSGKPFLINGDIDVSAFVKNYKKPVHARGHLGFNLHKKTVLLKNIKIKTGSSNAYLQNMLFNFNLKIFGFNLSKINVFISDLSPFLYFIQLNRLYGKTTGEISYRKGIYNGKLNLINFGYNRKSKVLSNINTVIEIKNNLFKKEKIPVNIFNNPCFLSIASTDKDLSKIYINVESEKIIYKRANGNDKDQQFRLKLPFAIAGKIYIKTFQYGKLNFSNFNFHYEISRNKLDIKRFSGGFLNGNLTGKGRIVTSGPTPTLSAYTTFNGIKVQEIFGLSDKFKNRIFGVAKGNANIEFNLKGDILKSIKGKMEMSINKGKIVNTGIQNGLGIWLSELKYKLKNLEFNKIYGNFDISNQQYTVNSFIFNSKDIRLKLMGTVNQKFITRNMRINLEFTKRFIQDVPGAVSFTLRKYLRGKWYIIPFLVKGDITKSKNIKLMK